MLRDSLILIVILSMTHLVAYFAGGMMREQALRQETDERVQRGRDAVRQGDPASRIEDNDGAW